MLESTVPRNNQPETHPDDERRRRPLGRRLHRMERFPDAWENSSKKPPRSGILFVLRFEFRWRQIAKRGVKPLFVIDLFEKLSDTGSGFTQVAVLVAMDLLVLQRFHKGFASRVGLSRQLRPMRTR